MGEPGVRSGAPRLGLLARAHLDPVALTRPPDQAAALLPPGQGGPPSPVSPVAVTEVGCGTSQPARRRRAPHPDVRLGPLGAGPARDTHDADEMVRSRPPAERALQQRHRSELMTLAGPLHVAFRWRHA